MRILLLNDGGTPVGGAEQQALRMRELLREAGHDVRLLTSTASELSRVPDVDATCFGTTHPRLRVLTQTANPSAVLALRRELARFRPDVVHLRMYLTQLSPMVLALLHAVPTVWQAVEYKAVCPRGTKVLPDGTRCTVHSGVVCLRNRCVTPQSWTMDMLQQRLWRRWAGAIDTVVTLTEGMRRRLEGEGIPVACVIPNGVPARPSRPPLADPPTVAFAGRLVQEKGADVLVQAFARAVSDVPDARLLIAGAGPQRDAIESLARHLGIAGSTTFLGHLDRDALEHRFERAWVQAIPGRWEEPLGNVTLEAMMRGTAIVATAVGGPAEIVNHGRNGVLVAPNSIPELADALRALLTDRRRCEELGAHGRATALDRYSEQRVVDRFEELYLGLQIGRAHAR